MALYDLPVLKETYSDKLYALLLSILETSGGSSSDIIIPRLSLIASVKVKIDELMSQSEGIQFSLADTDNSNVIDLYINSLLDETAKQIHQTAPLHVIIPNDGGEIDTVANADKSGYLYLPSDYLRFVSFKMQGWKQSVTEPITISNPKYKAQKYLATRGGIAKPVVALNSGIKINTPVKKVVSVLLSGTSGSCNINVGGVERLAEFRTLAPNITVPDAPTIGVAVAGYGEATIPFTAPANDGGLPITSYKATSYPGGFTGTISQAGSGSINVSGLASGIAYTFTVTAINAIGISVASAASNPVTPLATTQFSVHLNEASEVCSTALSTVYVSGGSVAFAPGLILYSDLGLHTLVTGHIYVSPITSPTGAGADGTVYNLNTTTGVVGTYSGMAPCYS